MTKFKRFQERIGLSNKQLAQWLDVSTKTIERYRNGSQEAPKAVMMCLQSIISNEAVKIW